MSKLAIDKKKNSILKVISGAIVSVCVTLILILVFALLIRFMGIKDNWIFPVNQAIKIISLFFGVFVVLKGNKEKGLVKGIILGFAYYILSFITFSILQGSFAINIGNFYDLILTTLMGGIIGLILVHIGK